MCNPFFDPESQQKKHLKHKSHTKKKFLRYGKEDRKERIEG